MKITTGDKYYESEGEGGVVIYGDTWSLDIDTRSFGLHLNFENDEFGKSMFLQFGWLAIGLDLGIER